MPGCHHDVPNFLGKTMAEVASLLQPLSLVHTFGLEIAVFFPVSLPPLHFSHGSFKYNLILSPMSDYMKILWPLRFLFLDVCVLDYMLAVGVQNEQG